MCLGATSGAPSSSTVPTRTRGATVWTRLQIGTSVDSGTIVVLVTDATCSNRVLGASAKPLTRSAENPGQIQAVAAAQ
jgi:hypothetical protein